MSAGSKKRHWQSCADSLKKTIDKKLVLCSNRHWSRVKINLFKKKKCDIITISFLFPGNSPDSHGKKEENCIVW